MNIPSSNKVAPHGGLRVNWQMVIKDAEGNVVLDTHDWTAQVHETSLSGDEVSIRTYMAAFFTTQFGTAWSDFVRRYSAARGDANNARQPRNPDFGQVEDNEVKTPDWNRPNLHDQYEPPDGVMFNRVHNRVPWAPTQVRWQDGQIGTDLPPPTVVRDR